MRLKDKILSRYGLLFISISFSIMWFFLDGVQIANDTQGYVNLDLSREPLYPIILAMFRKIFGSNNYFVWVGVFQCILSGFAMWFFCDTLYKKLSLKMKDYMFCQFICFGVCLLNRFLAARKSMYSLDIASEGIAIPLYYIFITLLFLFLFDTNNKKYLYGITFFGILLILTRKQMYIVVPIIAVTFFILFIYKKIQIKKLIFLFGLVLMTVLLSVILDMGYNKLVRGTAVRHSADFSGLLITSLYTADIEDGVLIEDESIRKLFEEIITNKDKKEWGFQGATGGWLEISDHYSNHFDLLAFEIVNPAFNEYINKMGIEGEVERGIAFDQINDYMLSHIWYANSIKNIKVFAANVLTGLCNTVAKSSAILFPIVLGLYVLYIVCIVYLRRHRDAEKEVILGLIILFSIIINTLAVSIMIFAQSRYMIYNMPMFYCIGYIMTRKIFWVRQNSIIKEGNDCIHK